MEEADWYENDPGRWGASLLNAAEIVTALLGASGARSVVEIGAYAGDLTRVLADWAVSANARVIAIDPAPEPPLADLAEQRPEVELIRETSHDALPRLALPDAVIIDGDHNYYTVSEELRLIAEKAAGAGLPLLMFHDVGWPHARRDTYFAPEQIPEAARQPLARAAGLFPREPGLVKGGLTFPCAAQREGGSRNGVLTAIEDFMEGRESLRLATVPLFFGFGILWDQEASWSSAVADILEPWDANPVLERLEANRVYHLATVSMLLSGPVRGDQLLANLLESRLFALADRLSRLRRGGRAVSWREQIRQALEDDGLAVAPDSEGGS